MTEQAPREPWVFLQGLPPMDEYLSFLTQAAAGQNFDIQAAAASWRAAGAVYADLQRSEAGIADSASVAELSTGLADKVKQFLNDPAVLASYVRVPASLAVVPLAQLIVFQRQINLRYVHELRAGVGQWSAEDPELLDFCLDVNQPEPPITRFQAAQNGFVFQSISSDARFLGAAMLDAVHVGGYVPQGRARTAIVLYVGYGANALNVIDVGGRLIINNGSHRAYALLAAGITHAPVVIQHASTDDELTMAPSVLQNKALYLGAARPPMLKDYFDNRLFDKVEVPRKARQIQVQFSISQLDVSG